VSVSPRTRARNDERGPYNSIKIGLIPPRERKKRSDL